MSEEEDTESFAGEDVIQSEVIWEYSKFASPTKKFPSTITVVEDDLGRKILDPADITWRTPKDDFGRGYPEKSDKFFTNKDGTPKGGDQYGYDKPISLAISKDDIIEPMLKNNIGLKIESTSQEGIFAEVVQIVANIWNTPKADGNMLSTREFSDKIKMSEATWGNFLHVADYAGLFMPLNRGKRLKAPSKPTIEKLAYEKSFEDWKKNRPEGYPENESPVNVWIRKNKTDKTLEYYLWKAMAIMQVTPTMMLELAERKPKVKAIEALEDLLQDERYPDPRNSKNILPKKKMVKNEKGELVLPKALMTTKGKRPRCWFYGTWDKYHGGENNAGVSEFNPKTKADQYENKKWSLEDWSNSMDAPDPAGGVKSNGKYKGVWFGTPRMLKKKLLIERPEENNMFYEFVGLIRQFMDTHGMGIGKQPAESPLSQIANPPHSAMIRLSVNQIEMIDEELKKGMKGEIMQFVDYDLFREESETIKFKDKEEAKSFWHDAYFYWKLALELGFRAEEAFTLVATELTVQTVGSSTSGKSGVFIAPNGDMTLNVYTRKSEKGKKGQKIHGGFIVTQETQQLVRERLRQIKEGMNTTPEIALKEFGVVKEFDGAPYEQHSLIGADGKYTELNTLDLPATAWGKDADRGFVKPVEQQRNKIRAIFRHCYQKSELADDYWYEHTLHSLRHVFAQYWLELSNYNYGFVADIGHWKTISIVKDVYGKKTGGETVFNMRKYATEDPMKQLKKLETERQNIPSATTELASMFYGGTEEELDHTDKILREKIFAEGGDYYDVRLPADQRKLYPYPKGTNIGLDKNSTVKPLFKKESKADATTTEQLDKGK